MLEREKLNLNKLFDKNEEIENSKNNIKEFINSLEFTTYYENLNISK
jgi:hypothetical protein